MIKRISYNVGDDLKQGQLLLNKLGNKFCGVKINKIDANPKEDLFVLSLV